MRECVKIGDRCTRVLYYQGYEKVMEGGLKSKGLEARIE
jgi:hypothetical protein